ncbi:hypothetical protein PLESTB_001282600 [Pleodorina starrii]|uniref:Uncharacterized protein n=1 Tax=Pleodorina starrii TaxID=330485 RepID=A0A9W6BTD6_9CHLO|nr:hypothetical protein PLESTB_001282600 [Pleodorina starrii]
MRIALVSMSTGRTVGDSTAAGQRQTANNFRSAEFAGLLDLTGPNKRLYAELHGYSYIDASDLLDYSRPASWSKIPAVLSVFDQYDWIFWLDADTLITNLTTPLERLLPPPTAAAAPPAWQGEGGGDRGGGGGGDRGGGGGIGVSAPDLLLTADSTGVNAGVWLIRGRGCTWCRSFLETWWSREGFIRRGPTDTKSGDNDALKALIAAMDSSELSTHVGLAPQCAFNSYVWRGSARNMMRYLVNPRRVLTGLWQPGDFVLHAAGVHNKAAVLRDVVQRQQQQQQQQKQKQGGQQHQGGQQPMQQQQAERQQRQGALLLTRAAVATAATTEAEVTTSRGIWARAGVAARLPGIGRELLRTSNPGWQGQQQQQQQLAGVGAGAGAGVGVGVRPGVGAGGSGGAVGHGTEQRRLRAMRAATADTGGISGSSRGSSGGGSGGEVGVVAGRVGGGGVWAGVRGGVRDQTGRLAAALQGRGEAGDGGWWWRRREEEKVDEGEGQEEGKGLPRRVGRQR